MDLSKFKWPIIIAVVVGVGWLLSSPGVDFMYRKFSSGQIGASDKEDRFNESGLSKLGGYLMMTFRYGKAEEVYQTAVQNFPDGKNYYYNMYRIARCAEKKDEYGRSVQILEDLMAMDASTIDKRIPENDALRLRADKLIEMHELQI